MREEFKVISRPIFASIFALGLALNFSTLTQAQTEDSEHAKHLKQDPGSHGKPAGPLDQLQKAIEKNSPKTTKKAPGTKPGTPAMPQEPMKPAMKMDSAPAVGMGGGGMMGMMSQMMGQMMPSMPSPQASSPPSSELPGFPGASHIYHIGATGFFVDHAAMVKFSTEQLSSLNGLKEKSLLAQSALDRKAQRAEEELWTLTASDRPDIKTIEGKVREIESLKGEKRISFIRFVGEAANLLTPEQRSILLGTSPPKSTGKGADQVKKPNNSVPKADSMNSMGDM